MRCYSGLLFLRPIDLLRFASIVDMISTWVAHFLYRPTRDGNRQAADNQGLQPNNALTRLHVSRSRGYALVAITTAT
jgi:hypothetical protein